MQAVCFQPIHEEPDDNFESLETGLANQQSAPVVPPEEERILYPRRRLTPSQSLFPACSPTPPRPLPFSDRDGNSGLCFQDDVRSSTGLSSPTCLSDASNKPLGEVGRPAICGPGSKDSPAFRAHRLVRDQIPLSDPESFPSSTRTAYWPSRRENRRTAWISNNPLRPKSPLHRLGSAFISRNLGRLHVQRHNTPIDDRNYLSPTGSEYHANAKPHDLTGQVFPLSNHASAHGGFADVWMASWETEKVAVKVLRLLMDKESAIKKLRKRLRRELRVWRDLHHDHVLPLYGTTTDYGPHLSMVCPWMENGTLTSYLERQGPSFTLSARFKILCEVAAGLSYLHTRNVTVIHGDLTGSNVLIDESGIARLSDFGLSVILAKFQGTSYFTSSIRGSVRYAAREIYTFCDNEPSQNLRVSTNSDIYSLGSVTLQTLSGKVPYHYVRHDPQVLWELFNSELPKRPSEPWITEDHWRFINKCWNFIPADRPTIIDVVSYVRLCYDELCA